MLQYTFGLKGTLEVVGTPEDQSETKNMLRSTITAITHIIYLSSRFDLMAAEPAAVPADEAAQQPEQES